MKISIIVQNLKCRGCAHSITAKLSETDTISAINVDIETSVVSFNSSNKNDIINIKKKLKTLGYPSIQDYNSLTSKAKSFVSCATGKFSK